VALVENAVIGGAASVAGGGKFANGAITGAFGYMFNSCGGPHGCAFWGGAIGTGAGLIAAAGCDFGSAGVCVAANPGIIGVFGSGLAAIGAGLDIIGNAWTGNVYNNDDGSSGGSRRPNVETQAGADAAATDAEGKLRCFYCNGEMTTESGQPNSREYDHMTPWSRGGDSLDDNIVSACRTCNREKGAQTPWEYGGRQ
jgi:hypothetical protein